MRPLPIRFNRSFKHPAEGREQTGGRIKNPSPRRHLRRRLHRRFIRFLPFNDFHFRHAQIRRKIQIQNAVGVLKEKGFAGEVFLLNYLTSYRANDNWLNASTKFENAYAATNFPFEIMTVYPDFFVYTADDTERAAILLHEAQHLKGADEKEAYEYVWRNRSKLGWTRETHGSSVIWQNVRRQTREFAPNLFVCDWNEAGDCTEIK